MCLSLLPIVDPSWPVGSAVDNWNNTAEDRIKLSVKNTDCKTTVLVTVGIIDGGWGITEYDKNGYRVRVTFSPDVPMEHRAHVVCHELGHVLGLPHRFTQDSCMNPDLFVETPSPADLQGAGKNYWQFAE